MLMSDNASNDLSETLRRWLDEGNLDGPNSIFETLNIGQIKRRAAQRVLTAQRSRHDA